MNLNARGREKYGCGLHVWSAARTQKNAERTFQLLQRDDFFSKMAGRKIITTFIRRARLILPARPTAPSPGPTFARWPWPGPAGRRPGRPGTWRPCPAAPASPPRGPCSPCGTWWLN